MSEDYLDGSIYHMMRFDNLIRVFSHGKILSKSSLDKQGMRYDSIANEEVQNLRERIFVEDYSTKQYRPLHSYVPFYFATHTPMLYRIGKQYGQDDIVIFEISRSILRNPGVVFTNGNASMQQLSKGGTEKVGIRPATALKMYCERIYKPQGPLGSNIYTSDFYSDISLLDFLDWNIINGRDFSNAEATRIKHAETLVPDSLNISDIQTIIVSKNSMLSKVRNLMETDKYISVVFKPDMFF